MSVEGVASTTLCASACSISWGCTASAAARNWSPGNEQDHELRRAGKLRPVGLGGQLAHPRGHLLGVALQVLTPARLVRRLERRQVGIERRLGIDHQLARIGQVHDQVRARGPWLPLTWSCSVKSHCSTSPGQFHDAPQREFAPAAAHFRTAQRGHQIAGLAFQPSLAARQLLDLAAQRWPGFAAIRVEPLRLGARGFERRLQRRHQLRKLLFAAPAGQQLGGQITQCDPDQQRCADQRQFQS